MDDGVNVIPFPEEPLPADVLVRLPLDIDQLQAALPPLFAAIQLAHGILARASEFGGDERALRQAWYLFRGVNHTAEA